MKDYSDLKYVSYGIALKLKDIGYDEVCLPQYITFNDNTRLFSLGSPKKNFKLGSISAIAAPTIFEVIDWIKEKYSITIAYAPEKMIDIVEGDPNKWIYGIYNKNGMYEHSYKAFSTYEAAIEAALNKVIDDIIAENLHK